MVEEVKGGVRVFERPGQCLCETTGCRRPRSLFCLCHCSSTVRGH